MANIQQIRLRAIAYSDHLRHLEEATTNRYDRVAIRDPKLSKYSLGLWK